MQFLKKLFRNNSEINHLKQLIKVQEEIIEVHESTLSLLNSNYTDRNLKALISNELREAKDILATHKKALKKLES